MKNILQIEMMTFGSAIVKKTVSTETGLTWISKDGETVYTYSSPNMVIEEDGTFYHLYFTEGYHNLSERSIHNVANYASHIDISVDHDGQIIVQKIC